MQFLDEKDLARALILALENPVPGIFNVAGEGVVALSHAIRHAQALAVPVPPLVSASLVRLLTEVSNISFPPYLLEYFKYPTIVSDDLFRKTFGYQPKVKTVQSLRNLGPISQRPLLPGGGSDESV
jgi:UDP-glucose 4-epimerase